MGIIKQKWGHCVDCEPTAKDQPLTAGRCPMHYKVFRSLVSEEKSRTRSSKLIVNERMNRIFGQPVPELQTIEAFKKGMTPVKDSEVKTIEKEKKTELEKWFDYVATIIKATPFCMNCGEAIDPKYYRHASAHILPKSIFLSVSTHPMNFLILGASCGCHPEFDHDIDKAAQMKIFPLAIERFKTFEHLILENHKHLELFKSKI